jgi:phage terminase small subunit
MENLAEQIALIQQAHTRLSPTDPANVAATTSGGRTPFDAAQLVAETLDLPPQKYTMPIAKPPALTPVFRQAIEKKQADAILSMWNDDGEYVGQVPHTSQEYKYKRFVDEYLVDFNTSRAALAAGFIADGDQKAAVMAGNTLRVRLAPVIAARTKTIAGRCGIRSEAVLAEIRNIAHSNVQDFLTEDNSIVKLRNLPREKLAAVKKITVDAIFAGTGADREQIGEKIKVEFYDKLDALKLLGSHLGVTGKGDDGTPGTPGGNTAPIIILFGDSKQAQRLQVENRIVPDAGAA